MTYVSVWRNNVSKAENGQTSDRTTAAAVISFVRAAVFV